MLANLEQDIATYRKRVADMKAASNIASKHASQCELMDANTHFGQLQLASKTAIAKSAQANHHRHANELLNTAEKGLDEEVSNG